MNTPGISIQPIQPADAALLRQLAIQTFFESFADQNTAADMEKYLSEKFNSEQIALELGDPQNQFFYALFGAEPIGYIKLRAGSCPGLPDDSKALEIERIYVLKAHHDKKVGAALMQYCIKLAQGSDFDTIWLGVWEHNQRAIAFYERWGFEVFGSHPFVLGTDEQTDWLMKKDLSRERA